MDAKELTARAIHDNITYSHLRYSQHKLRNAYLHFYYFAKLLKAFRTMRSFSRKGPYLGLWPVNPDRRTITATDSPPNAGYPIVEAEKSKNGEATGLDESLYPDPSEHTISPYPLISAIPKDEDMTDIENWLSNHSDSQTGEPDSDISDEVTSSSGSEYQPSGSDNESDSDLPGNFLTSFIYWS